MKPLTLLASKSLKAIVTNGGEAHPMGGGRWRGKNGKELQVWIDRWGPVTAVTSQTIYALERRGLVARMNRNRDMRRDPRKVTVAGYEALI